MLAKVFVKDVHNKDQLSSIFMVARKTPTVAKNGKGSPMLFRVQRQDQSLFLTVTV